MHIGVYFGSFNPIHTGHLIIASYVADYTSVDEVWLVVSPQNPLKPSHVLLNEHDRLHLVQIAIEADERLKACDVEFALPKPSYTIDTLTHLSHTYPQHTFSIIMGSDSYQSLPKWKNYKQIIEKYNILVYPRPGIGLSDPLPNAIVLKKAPIIDISSTYIRTQIQQQKNLRYIIPNMVREEIERKGYYQ